MADCEKVRCRKCRKVLFSSSVCKIFDAHEQECHVSVGVDGWKSNSECTSVVEQNCLYLSEESYPEFVEIAVNESSWTKGKLFCPGCQARLGSFNFVSGSHCACGSHIVPHVHLLKTKVDWIKVGEVLPHPISFPNQKVLRSSSEARDVRNPAFLTGPREAECSGNFSEAHSMTVNDGNSCNGTQE